MQQKVKKQCCTSFVPSIQMLNLFDLKIYYSDKKLKIANFDDLFTTITILNSVKEEDE